MATSQTDYEGWTVPFYWADRDDALKAALEGLATFFRAKVAASGAAAEPGDFLAGLELGDSAAHNDVRLYYDGTNLLVQANTGTEASPSWTTRLTISPATGDVTAGGGLTVGDDIDLAGADLLNVNEVNGVDVSAHADRHAPGGADELGVATPSDIGATNAEGVSDDFVRADHQHRGVRSVNGDFGDITVLGGGGISVAGGSGIVSVEATTRTYCFYDSTPGDITLSATSPTAVGGFANIGLNSLGANGSVSFLLRFTGTIATATATADTLFAIHVGSAGTVSDTVVATDQVETAASGDFGKVVMEAVVTPASGAKATVSYDAITGAGNHTLQGSSSTRPVLTITRLTSATGH